MTRIERESRRPWRGAVRFAMAGLLIAGTGSAFGCLSRPIAENKPRSTSTIVERLTQSSVDKIDLLLAIDNSGSMADKQDVLADAIPDLVQGLVNPRCIHRDGVMTTTVDSPNTPCPPDYKREFEPVKDIHIGIISSSLGGHGSVACQAATSASNVDMAHLLARSDENSNVNDLPTYLNLGFLAWDPDQKLDGEPETPDPNDGEADIGPNDSNADLNNTTLVGALTAMVEGTGQTGCGFEAQLESVYRFLVDPEPYATIGIDADQNVVVTGEDAVVKKQRADFMRPSSLLAIIMLTDENDCSIREEGKNYLVADTTPSFRLWRPRSECATDPGNKCCRSCSQNQDDCPKDDTCKGTDGNTARLTKEEDPVNSRCWDQKRRFGFDFLYPIDRYRRAFTEAQIPNRRGELVPNPIFSDPNPDDLDSNIRDPGLVFFAGIVGVPWQDIARQNAQGQPDLLNGLNQDGEPVGGFKNSDELSAPVAGAASTWELILGDPATYQPPKDPFMVESMKPRSGMNPITNDRIVGPTEAGWNLINGREYTIPEGSTGDLQYACIFDLPENAVKTCDGQAQSCDCRAVGGQPTDNPLCEPDAGNSQEDPEPRSTTQIKAKAYPGLRELQLIRELGPQGIVGSVCPRQLLDDDAADYGYRPAIGAIIDRLKTVLGGQCLPRTLTPDAKQQVSCLILEARNSQGQCNCADPRMPGRIEVTGKHKPAKDEVLSLDIAKASGWDCVCEIQQLEGMNEGEPAYECRTNVGDNVESGGQPVHGWCYVDPSIRLGDTSIVADCPSTEQRKIRFTGQGEAQQGATLFITCSGE